MDRFITGKVCSVLTLLGCTGTFFYTFPVIFELNINIKSLMKKLNCDTTHKMNKNRKMG